MISVGSHVLTEKEYSEVLALLRQTGLSLVFMVKHERTAYVNGMHFLLITDADGCIEAIYEKRGYHSRCLISRQDDSYFLVNSLSPYAEGAFKSRAEADKFENHPLVKNVYSKGTLERW